MNFSSGICRKFIYEYLLALDCPRALSVWLLYESGEHRQLVELDFDPYHYNDMVVARDSLAASKFLSKATFLNTGINLQEKAIEKFLEAEAVCADTNRRLSDLSTTNDKFVSLLNAMKCKILDILSDFDADEFVDACNWGPGATVSIKRRNALAPEKYLIESDTTADAYDFVSSIHRDAYPLWDRQFRVVPGNKIVTVPKNSKTDRTIAIEPGINLWYQKGIGLMLRRRLRRVGIDLTEQRHNQAKSRLGSKFNHLATIDFSMASDTIAKQLVVELIPTRWLALLTAFRSSVGVLNGKPLYYQKFSSMGNGFTFELESLIFYAAAFCVCRSLGLDTSEISVYGDDVILPSKATDLFSDLSAFLGFTVNKSKSYSSSYYRESCGEHFWNGVGIRPIFLKEPVDGKMSAIRTANAVRNLAHRRNSFGCDRRLRRCWSVLAGYVGTKCPRIPAGIGDLGLASNRDEAFDLRPVAGQLEGVLCPALVTIPVEIAIDHEGLLLFKLKSIGSAEALACSGNQIPLPLRSRYMRKHILIPRWEDFGPWI